MPNPILPSPDSDVAERYLAGTLNAEERAQFEAYCVAHPRYADAIEALRIVALRSDLAPPMSAAAALADLNDRMVQADIAARPTRAPSTSRRSHVRWYQFGVAVVVFTVAGLVGRSRLWSSMHTPHAEHTYRTATGQRATVRLADGSRVILAPRTTLTVPEPFGGSARDVTLVGEARFDVAPDRRAAFTVHTASVTTRVLGTTFDVRRYDDDHETHVVVLTGKVSAGTTGRIATLTAGMMGRFGDSSVVTTQGSSADDATGWVNGQLVFTDVPVPAMLATLSRWYGYAFQLDDSTLASRHATAVFNVEDRAETLRLLQGLLRVTITMRDSTVILHPEMSTRRNHLAPRRDTRDNLSSSTEVGR